MLIWLNAFAFWWSTYCLSAQSFGLVPTGNESARRISQLPQLIGPDGEAQARRVTLAGAHVDSARSLLRKMDGLPGSLGHQQKRFGGMLWFAESKGDGSRLGNPLVKQALFHLLQARRYGYSAQQLAQSAHDPKLPPVLLRERIQATQNWFKQADGLGLDTPNNLKQLRLGLAPTVTKGPSAGQIVEVDHRGPRSISPEFENESANLRFVPKGLNRQKSDSVTVVEKEHVARLKRTYWAASRPAAAFDVGFGLWLSLENAPGTIDALHRLYAAPDLSGSETRLLLQQVAGYGAGVGHTAYGVTRFAASMATTSSGLKSLARIGTRLGPARFALDATYAATALWRWREGDLNNRELAVSLAKLGGGAIGGLIGFGLGSLTAPVTGPVGPLVGTATGAEAGSRAAEATAVGVFQDGDVAQAAQIKAYIYQHYGAEQ